MTSKFQCWISNVNFTSFLYLKWQNSRKFSFICEIMIAFCLQFIQHSDVYKGCRSYRLFSQMRETYEASFMNVVLKQPPWLNSRVAFTVQLTVGNKDTIYLGTGHEPRLWMGVSGQSRATASLPLGKRAGTHSRWGQVGPKEGFDGWGKSRLKWDTIPRSFRP